MSFDLRAYLPSRISGQIVALVVASLIASHIVLTVFLLFHLHAEPPDRFDGQLAAVVELIAANPIEQRKELLASIDRAFPQFDLELAPSPPAASQAHVFFNPELESLGRRLGPSYQVIPVANGSAPGFNGARRVIIRLRDGQSVAAQITPMPPPPLFGPITITWIGVAFCIPLLSLWAAFG